MYFLSSIKHYYVLVRIITNMKCERICAFPIKFQGLPGNLSCFPLVYVKVFTLLEVFPLDFVTCATDFLFFFAHSATRGALILGKEESAHPLFQLIQK